MSESRNNGTFRAYAADIGRVAYLSLSAVIAATLVLERIAPGVAGNVVSPQKLVAAAILAGALALLAPSPTPAAWRTALYAASAVVLTLFVFSAGLAYFESMPAAFAAAFCAALPFLAYARGSMK